MGCVSFVFYIAIFAMDKAGAMNWRAEVGEKGARAWLWRDDVRICSVPSPLIDMLVGELNKTNAAPQGTARDTPVDAGTESCPAVAAPFTPGQVMSEMQGSWAKDDLRRAFVDGAKWWEWQMTGSTMFPDDVDRAESEADKRYAAATLKACTGPCRSAQRHELGCEYPQCMNINARD